MNDAITLVAGLGRCGTSLTMQMLAAGGAPVVGDYPAYEDTRFGFDSPWATPWKDSVGQVVKVLDPHRFELPTEWPLRTIWLDRNLKEQARSQAKILRLLCGIPAGRNDVRQIAAALSDSTREAIATLADRGPLMRLHFEDILDNPIGAAALMASFARIAPADIEKMAAVVRLRSPRCQPGMDIEVSLCEGTPA